MCLYRTLHIWSVLLTTPHPSYCCSLRRASSTCDGATLAPTPGTTIHTTAGAPIPYNQHKSTPRGPHSVSWPKGGAGRVTLPNPLSIAHLNSVRVVPKREPVNLGRNSRRQCLVRGRAGKRHIPLAQLRSEVVACLLPLGRELCWIDWFMFVGESKQKENGHERPRRCWASGRERGASTPAGG